MLVLVHRDPSLTIPLGVSSDRDELTAAWQMWSDIFALTAIARRQGPRTGGTAAAAQCDPGRRPKFWCGARRRLAQPATSIRASARSSPGIERLELDRF